MMFASKTPRDLNHDPKPLLHPSGKRTPAFSYHFEFEPGEGGPYGRIAPAIFDPRPEFDHVQHNPPNPILVDIRKYHSERQGMNNPKSWDHYLRVFESATRGGYPFVTADWGRITSEEHIDHARLVLTRLAALTKEQA